ncbi:DUF4032 domain-containing protein [Haliangium sp.]|uniref:DUF4032 domain-containing protein n=1 Tax=Haliangium sp. TaxID=2663208 RepID=UPI003D139913
MPPPTRPTLTIAPGHPDFLDLPWDRPLGEWDSPRLIDLPKGVSRHLVRFLAYDRVIYVVKELPVAAARRDYEVLRALAGKERLLAVPPVGLVEGRHPDHGAETSAALITRYLEFSFSSRELLQGAGFGERRNQMLDAFAGLLVELHIAGCFWGDCSLSNVLYRYDAEAVDTIMVDGETAVLHDQLSNGQREEDLAIMIVNVAGGMADIAAAQGIPIDDADLWLGEDIATRYRNLWSELSRVETIGPDERYKITERIRRINELGFDVKELDLIPSPGGDRLALQVRVGGRNHHTSRLKSLTGLEVSEWQARQILSDLHYYQAQNADSGVSKSVTAVHWRVSQFEPTLTRLRTIEGISDPVQAYCDLLHYRYLKSVDAGFDIGTVTALEQWLSDGRPGYVLRG